MIRPIGHPFARRGAEDETASSTLELFYDLVFAFTITQVSHLLIGHLDWHGALRAGIVLLGAWWSWNYTTWFTDELDAEATSIRLLLFGLMGLSLMMAIAIPEAFGSRALLFAIPYVAIQIGRHAFLAFGTAESGTLERERAGRILLWFVLAGIFWIGGAAIGGTMQIIAWIVALAIDYGSPLVHFHMPGRPRLTGDSWTLNPAHFTDRYACFIILTLGETIAITGATMTVATMTPSRLAGFLAAFVSAAVFWWIYFSRIRMIAPIMAQGSRVADLARDAFVYGHALLVGGILLSAVGDDIVIAHPMAALSGPEIAPIVLGPAIFLLAKGGIAWRILHTLPGIYLVGVLASLGVGWIGWRLEWPAVIVSVASLVVLAGVAFVAEFGHTGDRGVMGATA